MNTIVAPRELAPARVRPAPGVRSALASLALAMLLPSLGISSANVALPTLVQAFAAPFQQVQWVVLAYLLATTALIVGIGRLGDVLGRRRLLLAGIVVFTAGSLLGGFAPTLWLLVAARALQGMGAAAMMALSMAFVAEIVPKAETGRAMGLLGTMSAVGTALGPSLGGMLIAASGWRAIFLFNLPLGLAAFVLARKSLPEDRGNSMARRADFDGTGTVLLAAALAAYALAMTIGRGHFGRLNLVLLAGAAGLLGLFLLVEAKLTAPLIGIGLLRDGGLFRRVVTTALVSTVMMTTLVVGPFYLTLALGLNSAAVGLVLSIGPLVAAITGMPAGRWVDRHGANQVTLVGLIGLATGALALVLLPASAGVVGYIAPIVTMTVGYAFFQTANNTAVMRGVTADQRGVVSGILNLSRNLGLITGASLMGAIFAFASRSPDVATASAAAIATGMRFTFGLAAALIVAAVVIATGDRAKPTPE